MIIDKAAILQGLVRLQNQREQVVTRLLARRTFNRAPEKVSLGVPGKLGALAGELSFAKSPGSYVFFDSKTKRSWHATKKRGARGRVGARNLTAAEQRLNQYFPQKAIPFSHD